MTMTTTELDTIYTETTGTTAHLAGERHTVTGLHHECGQLVGAFLRSDETGTMRYARLGRATGDRGTWREVLGATSISRDMFDAITGLDVARTTMGWVA